MASSSVIIMRRFVAALLLLFPLAAQAKADDIFAAKLSDAAIERTTHDVTYDGAYFNIPYPNGDVPANKGVCTDVVIRSYRALGFDLQELVHEDMSAHFEKYPKHWGLTRTDKNIDHRRVPNLQIFFTRHGQSLGRSREKSAYKTGDLVTWNLNPNGNLPHIGIVTSNISTQSGNPMIVHNIGQGPKEEDILFRFPITGHYRYHPNQPNTGAP